MMIKSFYAVLARANPISLFIPRISFEKIMSIRCNENSCEWSVSSCRDSDLPIITPKTDHVVCNVVLKTCEAYQLDWVH